MKANVLKILFLFSLCLTVIALQTSEAKNHAGRSITGAVRFEGPPPEPYRIEMPDGWGGQSECASLHENSPLEESVIVGPKGELANVFLYIKDGLKKKSFRAPKKGVLFNQEKCLFRPHVLGIQVGQKLLIKNSDPTLHNVRSFSVLNRPFNVGQPAESEIREKVFKRPESALKVNCDVHKWMVAYIFVLDHPYFAVSDENGEFRISGLPPGKYTLAAWHEVYGEITTEIVITADGTSEISFNFQEADTN